MSIQGLALAAVSVSALLGMAAILLSYPRSPLGPGMGRPVWAISLGEKLSRPFPASAAPLSLRRRVLMGGTSALPLAGLEAYLGLPWLWLPALAVFLAAPELHTAYLSARRRAMVEAQVPQAVEVLCQALKAGHNLYHSLAQAAQEVGPPLREDLQRALDRFSVTGDMAYVLGGVRQGAASKRLGALLDVLIFDLEEGVAGTPGEVERLECFRESLAQEDAVRREMATKTAGARFNLRLVSFIIPGTIFMVAVTDGSLLAPLLSHPLGNLSLAVALVAYFGTLYLAHRWSQVEL